MRFGCPSFLALPSVVTIFTSQEVIQEEGAVKKGVSAAAFGTQEACNSECLVEVNRRFGGIDKIPVKFLRGGKMLETTIDLSGTRRNFLEGIKD